MYNWIDGRKYSNSKYFPTVNYVSKKFIPYIKNPFEGNTFKRLPVIKEEDGYVSEDELQLPQSLLSSSLMKKKYSNQSACSSDFEYEDSLKDSKSLMKLPPLININCMMNTEIKQTQSIWDTNFGKRLISGKNVEEEQKSTPIATKKVRPNSNNSNKSNKSNKSCCEKIGECQEPKEPNLISKKKPQSTTTGERKKGGYTDINKKKPKSATKSKQNSKKKSNNEKEPIKKSHSTIVTRSTVTFKENPSREFIESSSTTVSSFSKNQRFLTECVQSILDGHSAKVPCEHCSETFRNVEELCSHKKQHEAEKEVCLLCEKVFYNPNEFIQHLLTHEGVDKFSCRKCKKYFPNLRKYKQHCLDFHFTSPDVINNQSPPVEECVKQWLPKFECKRCKIEFDSEEKKEAHRRNHVKKDLIGAYLLSAKDM